MAHVARRQLRRLLAFELEEEVLRHFAEHVDGHVQPSAVRHADDHLLHAGGARALDDFVVNRRNQTLAPSRRFWPTYLSMQVALQVLGFGELLQQALLLGRRYLRRSAQGSMCS